MRLMPALILSGALGVTVIGSNLLVYGSGKEVADEKCRVAHQVGKYFNGREPLVLHAYARNEIYESNSLLKIPLIGPFFYSPGMEVAITDHNAESHTRSREEQEVFSRKKRSFLERNQASQ